MALQIAYTDPATNVAAPTCYVRINRMSIERQSGGETVVTILAYYFLDSTTAGDNTKVCMQQAVFATTWAIYSSQAGTDPLTRAYNYLLTLPDFAGAVSV